MFKDSGDKITPLARVFLEPSNSTHRQYEALRAYFVEGLSSSEVASRFGYTPGSFRVLASKFRANPQREFFLPPAKGPREAPRRDRTAERVVELRKRNLSIYDIARELASEGRRLSPASVYEILKRWTGLFGQLFLILKWCTAHLHAAASSLGSVSQ